VQIHLVLDPSINAFIADGQRVFLMTGLLLAAESPLQILGVIAHETGHIAGGHVARTQDALRAASAQTIAAMLLGVAVAAGVDANAGVGVMLGGSDAALRNFLLYSRAQESAADLAAVRILSNAGLSPRGLLEFTEILARQNVLMEARQDPYLRSHPVFPERLATLRSAVAASALAGASTPPGWDETFARLKAKLYGYVETPARVLREYPVTDTGTPAHYARAVMFDQAGQLDDSLAEIEALLATAPDDPFFLELQGQVLLHHGRVEQALAPYRRAVELLPGEPQLRVGLASAEIATGELALMADAIHHLTLAVQRDRELTEAWRQLAVAYGRTGELGLSSLASAEQHMSQGSEEDARRFVAQALRRLPENTPGWLRAQDIETALENQSAAR
jgi:predicted Zn-dependent protease